MNLDTEHILILIEELEEFSNHVQNKCNQVEKLCLHTIYNYEHSDDQKLSDYRIMLEDNIFWQSRDQYLTIIEEFLTEKLDGREFSNEFCSLRSDNLRTKRVQEENLKTKTDFQFTSKSIGFSELIDYLFSAVEIFDSNLKDWESSIYGLSELGLKTYIQNEILPKIRTYCEETRN
jgi:hypothetical protein